jgi:hypothetical protein
VRFNEWDCEAMGTLSNANPVFPVCPEWKYTPYLAACHILPNPLHVHLPYTGVRVELHSQAGGHVSGHRPEPGVPGGLHRAPGQARHRDGSRYMCVVGGGCCLLRSVGAMRCARG